MAMNIRQIQEARELYGIEDWGAGYFSINDRGQVECHPTGEEHHAVALPDVIEEVKSRGVRAPMILRFPQIVESQLQRMHVAFRDAIWEYSYQGKHLGVFPFKVNQRREFIDSIVASGRKLDYGLEVGSKTELVAAMSYELSKDALLICNGFKDSEFIEMGFAAAALGKNVIVVAEGPDELQTIIDMSKKYPACPQIGLRVRLYSRGSGKWEKSSGDTSKFGLTTVEVLQALALIEKAELQSQLTMLHFHIGSQITEIKRFKNAMKEASRVYAKVTKMGFQPKFLNIGGGVGVDYDGSRTSFQSSANYTIQEFANDAVYVIGEVCQNESVRCPDIITESGRVIAAYHSVVVADVREVQIDPESEEWAKLPKGIHELRYILDNINRKNYVEFYHDSIEYHEELFTLFNLGYIDLKARATAEDYFRKVCSKALYFSSFQRQQLEEFHDLQKSMVNKYLANFSIFQSIPDAWSIDQLFPVMPLARHQEKPTEKGTIVDITCDSDGCLEKFIDRADVKTVLELHTPTDDPYYIGFFLVGAYQESLANEHNLFGAIHEVEVHIDNSGEWSITKITDGDPIDELLVIRNYDRKEILDSYQLQINAAEKAGRFDHAAGSRLMKKMRGYLKSYPYLIEKQ
jgi:arginine decarboxylase